MGFTRSTTNVDVHKNMPDSPSAEGMTALQLKTAFDSPAVGLKSDINRLEGELEATTAAANIGASTIYAGDDSASNLQAKLAKLHSEVEAAALGEIPDNSITEAKLTSSYSSTLAKKNGNVQTNLNSEKLGGKKLATIEAERTAAINSLRTEINTRQSLADTEYTIALTTSGTTYTKTFVAKSRFVLFKIFFGSHGCVAIFDCRLQEFTLVLHEYNNVIEIGKTSIGEIVHGFEQKVEHATYASGTITLDIYGKHDGTATNIVIRSMALDGLLP